MPKVGVPLHDAVIERLARVSPGSVLDVGTESGALAKRLAERGFQVEACDAFLREQWRFDDRIPYRQCDLNIGLPYDDATFDHIACLEVIEHVDNPFALCRELRRVLRKGGELYISTPNILNMRSRVKFLLDGSFLYFDLPPIEWAHMKGRPHVHVHPIRYHELEYYLLQAGLAVREAFTNMQSTGWKHVIPLTWAIRLYARQATKRSRKPGRAHLGRIYARVLSDDLLYGSHVIVRATPL